MYRYPLWILMIKMLFFLTAEKKLIHMTAIDPTHC